MIIYKVTIDSQTKYWYTPKIYYYIKLSKAKAKVTREITKTKKEIAEMEINSYNRKLSIKKESMKIIVSYTNNEFDGYDKYRDCIYKSLFNIEEVEVIE